ncbi:MAG: histidine triad nucleotide-binding protein [Legionella sp.]|nr:MAG: histidine triad nucleotide-binding protein [Legionella sp.]
MDCLFCKIAQGQIPAQVVYEDTEMMAFRDIAPQAPIHILLIPKVHIATINDASAQHAELLGRLVIKAQQLAGELECNEAGYRLVFNVNQHGGQAVYHIHLHLLGGRQMAWPPG